VSKTSISEHNINNQLSLPRYHPSLNQRNVQEKSNHETPIHVAARQGNVAVLKALFDSGHCDTPARDAIGQTALHIAVLALRIDVIQFFVDLNIEQFKVSSHVTSPTQDTYAKLTKSILTFN
jgi:ankyrin repeat protein